MSQDALGLIEVIGLTTAIEAADTCIKASNVQLIGYEKVTSGLVTVKVQGDVGAVKAAIEAAKISAGKVGVIVSTIIIPRPALGVHPLIFSTLGNNRADQEDQLIKEQTVNEAVKQVVDLSVVQEESVEKSLPKEPKMIISTCNLCDDEKCTREKGQPRTLCLHHQDGKTKKDDTK